MNHVMTNHIRTVLTKIHFQVYVFNSFTGKTQDIRKATKHCITIDAMTLENKIGEYYL